MYEKVFGRYPQVKVLNYVLINPDKSYTKKEISVGAGISRVTLDSFINELEDQKILLKDKSKYRVNLDSKVVNILINAQIQLANVKFEEDNNKLGEVEVVMNDDEFEEFIDSCDYEVDDDETLGEDDVILIKRSEYEKLKNHKNDIILSENNDSPLIINGYLYENKNRMLINYG